MASIETSGRDPNYVTTVMGISLGTPHVPTQVYVDESTHRLLVSAIITSGGGGGGDGAILDGVDGTIKATVFDYANSNPLGVVLRDTNGDYVSVGGGTQYTDAATPPAHPVGGAIVYDNGSSAWQAVNSTHGLPISASSLPLPTGASTVAKQPALGTAGTASADVITVQGIASMTALKVDGSGVTQPVSGTVTANAGTNLNTSTLALESGGNLAAIKADTDKIPSQGQALAAASMPVVLTAAQVTTLTPPSNTGYALDSSLTTIDTDIKSNITLHAGSNVIGHVIADSGSTTAVTGNVASTIADGADVTLGAKADAKSTATDTTAISIMSVLKQVSASVQAPPSQAVTNAGTFVVQATLAAETTKVIGTVRNLGNLGAAYDAATNAAPPANAIQIGGVTATALPSAYTVTDLAPPMLDKFGRQVTLLNAMRDLVLPMTQLTLTSTTTETSLIAAVASTFNDLVSLVVINTSATATQVDFRDSTSGTIRLSLYVPAGDTRGISLTTPLPQAAVNTAWTAKCGTSVASVIITGTYVTNK